MKDARENIGRCNEISSGKESKKINRKYCVLTARQHFGLTSNTSQALLGVGVSKILKM